MFRAVISEEDPDEGSIIEKERKKREKKQLAKFDSVRKIREKCILRASN